jgi:hypothetical protein
MTRWTLEPPWCWACITGGPTKAIAAVASDQIWFFSFFFCKGPSLSVIIASTVVAPRNYCHPIMYCQIHLCTSDTGQPQMTCLINLGTKDEIPYTMQFILVPFFHVTIQSD